MGNENVGRVHSKIDAYRKSLDLAIWNIPIVALVKVLEVLETARDDGRRIYLCGNGGSAMTAIHAVCDFLKSCGLRAISLVDNVALMTAFGNDDSYEGIFVGQLKALMQEGDVLIGISGSGNSENVLQALRFANEKGGITIAFLGFDGGKAEEITQIPLIVPVNDMRIAEDVHLSICHILTCLLVGKDEE